MSYINIEKSQLDYWTKQDVLNGSLVNPRTERAWYSTESTAGVTEIKRRFGKIQVDNGAKDARQSRGSCLLKIILLAEGTRQVGEFCWC